MEQPAELNFDSVTAAAFTTDVVSALLNAGDFPAAFSEILFLTAGLEPAARCPIAASLSEGEARW